MFIRLNDEWPRNEHFRHYMDNVRCTYSLTVQIDITGLRATLRANALKAYPVQIYMLATIVNRLREFRMAVGKTGEPGYWEMSHPSYTVFNRATETFSSIWTNYEHAFPSFYQACVGDIARYSQSTEFEPKPEAPPNAFMISAVPWINFTAFNLNVYSEGTFLAPIFTIGKYAEQDGRTLLPLSMQLHHAACDGYHAGRFVEALSAMAQDCSNWVYP